jgi:23S rRNA pseudouridine1911/1915/1917 synthase
MGPHEDTKAILNNPDFTVIDESPDYIVVDKPAHLLVHPSTPNNPPTLLDGLRHLLAYEIANGARLSIINRLDRETSGLTLVAKNRAAARHFGISMQNRRIAKEYLALVRGWPEQDEFTIDEPILRQGEVAPSAIWLKRIVHPEGAPSRTEVAVLERFTASTLIGEQFSLLRCRPETGRMHQIRVHLAHAGHSIVGDKIYGPDETCYLRFIEKGWTDELAGALLLRRHALHASALEVPSPDGATLHWKCPTPPEFQLT